MKRHLLFAVFVYFCSFFLGCLSFYPDRPPGTPKMGEFTRVGNEVLRFVDTQPGPPSPAAKDAKKDKGTVVLVHGFGATIEEWVLVIPALKEAGYRVLALDLLGHGWSGRPDADYSILAQARRVVALADQRGVKDFTVVGHSWGSSVSLAVAIAAPTRVKRVALYNGMYFEEQKPTLFKWAQTPVLGEIIYGVFYPDRQDEKLSFAYYEPEKHITEQVVEDVQGLLNRPGTLAAALAGVRAMRYSELQKRYPTVHQPVLLMWGREDAVTPLTYGERLLQQLPRARMVVYPRCGHLPMLEVPGASTQELLRFLAEEQPS
ncbi:MAG TPA: alpha/beta hydrolase [Polyangiaceae bacterium]|jgi:pimeloyl-ACP methyl ester carboxylesterase|nr:MAG: 2-hydroxymuconate semialdehyde hydrolase [Deltaproteobacteria bacterium ADurb.Bin207]HNS98650.1 alpha/beta hydrolase [Polyangiaceae bacterium]HNZ21014.1 alpha/beta hydrolase [Polyangiaceae bacterium]HOD24449.1 alpha/beta hydrolase [Polyangiaceae bacterium]HOE48824.1 alpha/beta hydrolase [Polyangiaceae bacterium]